VKIFAPNSAPLFSLFVLKCVEQEVYFIKLTRAATTTFVWTLYCHNIFSTYKAEQC